MKTIYKNIFLFILLFLILFLIFAGYKLYNKIEIANERIFKLEQLDPSYQKDKKLNQLEIEKIYLTELSRIRIDNFNYEFKKFQLNQEKMYPTGYVDIYENKIFFVSGDGNIYQENLDIFYDYKNENKLNLNLIKNNLIDLSGVKLLNKYGGNGFFSSMFVRDTYIFKDNLFVVCNIYRKNKNKIYVKPAILKAKIDFSEDYLDFKLFFNTDQEILYFSLNPNNEIDEIDDSIDFRHSGGRFQKYKDDKYIYSVPDYNLLDKVEDLKSIYGKNLIIDENNNFEILSYGHRNQQGLLYDSEKDIILSTEHGPSGGDEINLIKKNKGYGWPTISKGKDPQVISSDHSGNNYEEPIFFWKTNPGISQLIQIPKNQNKESYDRAFGNGTYLAASLRGSEDWSGRSLWSFKISKNNKVLDMKKIFVNDRIRDLVYDKNNEKIILVLENQISLGVIDIAKKNLLHNSF